MDTHRLWLNTLAASAALFVSVAGAQVMPGDTQQIVVDQIRIVNSGPDLDEVDRVKRQASAYPLRVEFSGKGGDFFVADKLSISRRGVVLAAVSGAGPWLLLDVPAGSYELQADFGDKSLRRTVSVGRGGTTVHWVVPNTID